MNKCQHCGHPAHGTDCRATIVIQEHLDKSKTISSCNCSHNVEEEKVS